MKKFFRRMSMIPKGLRYKLMIAFSLMSIIPLLVCVYLVTNFIFPHAENLGRVSIIVLLSITIALLGLILAKRMVDPVIDMALETKIIASGDFGRKLRTDREDEIGDLGKSINNMTKRIKDHMIELQSYSVKTKEINLEIQKRVLILSNLLQIGDMIAASEKLADVLNVIVEKASEIDGDNSAVLFLAEEEAVKMIAKASFNTDKKIIRSLSFNIDKDYLGISVRERKIIKIDSSTRLSSQMKEVCNIFKMKNCLIVPVVAHGKGIGFLLTGNDKDDFKFKDDDIEVVKVLNKQLGIAVENDMLLRKAKDLAVKDELTGLYNEKYIKERLDEEIKRAILYQRPCSLLLFNIDNFKAFRDRHGEMFTEEILKRVADTLRKSSTEVSKISRLGGDEFAIVLPEKNKREATQLAEEIRKKIDAMGKKEAKKGEAPLTTSGSVSENPIDGASSKELFDKATMAMKKAKLEGKNRIAT